MRLGGLALLVSLSMTVGQVGAANTYTSSTAKRWTDSSGNYDTTETYTDVLGEQETFKMLWELYEGSIALVQMALLWKEISEQNAGTTAEPDLQIPTTTTTSTTQVFRLRRIWQLASKGIVYDDENEQGVQQLYNDFANMEYVNPYPVDAREWFVGDVVPFERCAYVVNMNSDGTNRYYVFSRIQTAVRWDPILKVKKVVTQEDHTSDRFSRSMGTNVNQSDLPDYYVEMGWWPQKGSFFYFNRGFIHLKHDPDADMQDYCECPPEDFDADTMTATTTCEATLNRCDTSQMVDPCARDTPLFASGGSGLEHEVLRVAASTSATVHAVAWEVVFDSIFVVFSDNAK